MASIAIDPGVLRKLGEEEVAFCLIGGAALAAHGFARYTADVDLLTVDRRVLAETFWKDSTPPPELRRGDAEDPLGGIVRWAGEVPLDLVVGKGHAARFAVQTAAVLSGFRFKVATPLALTLLKLEAGSPQDRADITSLVSVQRQLNGASWLAEVPDHLKALTREARAAWRTLAADLRDA